MKLLAIIVALGVERYAAPDWTQRLRRWWCASAAEALRRALRMDGAAAGLLGWGAMALGAAVLTWLVLRLLGHWHPLLEWVGGVLVLLVCASTRQVLAPLEDARHTLRAAEPLARPIPVEPADVEVVEGAATPAELAAPAFQAGVRNSIDWLFAPLLWFLLLGAAGCVLYVVSAQLAQRWKDDTAYGSFALRAWRALAWLPARLTALSFAVVGDFEDALTCWRAQAPLLSKSDYGAALSSAAGALGVRMQLPAGASSNVEVGIGDDLDIDHLQSLAGLIWRALIVWMLLLLLISLSAWFA